MAKAPTTSTLQRLLRPLLRSMLGAVVLFLLVDYVWPVNTQLSYATLIAARDGTVLHAYLARDQQWRMHATLPEISPELKQAIVYKEDRYFYWHPGINIGAIIRAATRNVAFGRRTSGASTITMQVARMLEPKPRTYVNKCIELVRALQLELHYNKDEILQLYLNLVPYGGNIQGVKAASLLYFGRAPEQLSLAQITALSIIPNRPRWLVMGRDNARIVAERNKWLERFGRSGTFPQVAIRDALSEPLTAHRLAAPASVPQLAQRMKASQPGAALVRTTVDATLQQQAETITATYVQQLKLQGIYNASVLVVDNLTREVLVYIGSSDFDDRHHYGQVDGVQAVRSPGSTLKPLLYGLCIDQGIITPKTTLADIPTNIKGYSPENYDRLYRGRVTADFALSNSLNIPAVALLEQLGTPRFIHSLAVAGFATIASKRKEMGLSLILGGCGVRLSELTALYTAFANNGRHYPLRYTLPDSTGQPVVADTGTQLLSPPANYMLTRILSELHRPDLPNAFDEAQGIPRIAWKTGTSYGRRDAWSIGYNQRYTIGVWLGNFSAIGVPTLSGANTATPLLFRLFNGLDHKAANAWVEPPAGMSFRLVCAETGQPPGTYCQNQVMDYYLPGISTNDPCEHIKETWLSANGQFTYCTACLPPAGYVTRWLPFVPPALAAYYQASGVPYTRLPPHYPACTRGTQGHAPVITSLAHGTTYIIENRKEQQLQLACTAAPDVEKVYWYLNDQFYGTAPATGKLLFTPNAAQLKISCTDDKGRTSHLSVRIRYL